MIKRIFQVVLLLIMLILTSGAWATTYYIDYENGSDLNNGTSKATPWQLAPGMNGCANNCLAKQTAGVLPGDEIILKGGVTWLNASMGWLWTWSGNATASSPGCSGGGCIYIGVDQTWYSGGSWSRPILNAGGAAVAARDFVPNVLLRIYANYLVIDNIEFIGLYWTGNPPYGSSANLVLPGGTPNKGTNITLKNLYIHGWAHNTFASGTVEHPCGILGDTSIPNNNANTILQDSVIDGSDTARDSCSGIFGAPPYIERNYINYVSSGMIVNGTIKIDGNTITNVVSSFDTTAHTNGIEINASQDVTVSNNVIAHLGSGTLALWVAPNEGYTATVFGNVIYDTDVGNILDVAAPVTNNGCANDGTYCLSSGTTHFYNNTVECGPDANPNAVCVPGISKTSAGVTIINNHFITNATTPNGGAWSLQAGGSTTVTASNNVVQSKATANAQGYTSATQYPFSANGATVGQGMNLQGRAGVPAAASSSTSGGVSYDAVNHKVLGPKIP